MTEPAAPVPPDPAQKLRATIAAFPGKGFAVVDGGHFEDLPALFKRERLFARSLFLDSADDEVQKAGPWLVKLGQGPDSTHRVLAMLGNRPAAVFWCCDAGEAVLYRHLRTLNIARIPAWAAAGASVPPIDPVEAAKNETVMFRHWDPRVLGAFMPVLSAAQFARILGPASEVAFQSEDYGGVRRVLHDPTWPPPEPGVLRIGTAQSIALSERRMSASRRRIAAYLRDVAPDHTRDTSDDDLLYQVQYSERVGKDLGISSERAHAQWAFLMVTSKGQVANEQRVTSFICAPGTSPDRQVDAALRHAIAAARERDGAG